MATALIVGASRGIGLEFVRQYIEAGWTVFATHRSEDDRIRLRDLGAHTLKLDVLEPNDIAGMAWQLDGERIDVAVVNAGVYGPRTSHIAQPPTDAEFDLVMRTNVLAAMRLVPVLAPLLVPARGTLAFLSSRMGSIAEASAAYGMLYRVSKAAVNMVARLAHAEYGGQGVRVLSLHPGWVRTDMGGERAPALPAEAAAALLAVLDRLGPDDSGLFLGPDGAVLPW